MPMVRRLAVIVWTTKEMGIFITIIGITEVIVAAVATVAIAATLDVLAVVTAIFKVAHCWTRTSSEEMFTIHVMAWE
jgi:hypothetical protein